MGDQILLLLTRGAFILIFGLTLVEFLRRRDLAHLEVAALFGGLALIIVLQLVTDLTSSVLPAWATIAGVLAFLAQPFLLLRVLGQFRSVSTRERALGIVGLIVSCAVYLIFGSAPPTWGALAIAVAFTYVEAYATLAFVRTALENCGVIRWRLLAVAFGSGCLAAVIALAGASAAVPQGQPVLDPLLDLFALCSALGYYVGLAPPRWLRRIWQDAEVKRFLLGLIGQAAIKRVESALEYLGPAAARATGGNAAIVGLLDNEPSGVLSLHADAAGRSALERTNISHLTVDGRSTPLASALRTGQPLSMGQNDEWGAELNSLGAAVGARGALIAPLVSGGRTYGLFIVFVNRAALFADDDLAVLKVLADQAALAIESRRLFEESMRERSTLAAVMTSMHEGLLVMDEDNIIRYCSARAEQLLDVDQSGLVGTHARFALADVLTRLANSDQVTTQWRRALRDADQRSTIELQFSNPGRDIQAEVFTVNDVTGGRRGVGVVLRDVTTERDLVRTKDELVSVVSHELRTPLASVVGFAELLRTRELKEAQRQQFLTVIVEEGRRLTALINDFLDLQRMESGRQELAPRPLALHELLQQCVEAAGDDPTRPIELETPADLPAVRVDSDRVQQVMANLLSNARKYSPRGGSVHVAACKADGQVIVSVRDQGLGLPAEALPRLFEKFYRVDNSDRRSITGTGLGLAISRKIVEAHGGRIWAESEGLGQGSRFLFSLPVADSRNTSGDVLIVEDDAGFARLLEAEFSNRRLSAVWVPSAEEALEQLAHEQPKVLVLDLLLPGLQGEAFLRTIRSRDRSTVPVIVVTVKDLSQTERAALEELGVVAMLRKEPSVGATASKIIHALVQAHSAPRAQRGVAA